METPHIRVIVSPSPRLEMLGVTSGPSGRHVLCIYSEGGTAAFLGEYEILPVLLGLSLGNTIYWGFLWEIRDTGAFFGK